jgi:hypothetical protein
MSGIVQARTVKLHYIFGQGFTARVDLNLKDNASWADLR